MTPMNRIARTTVVTMALTTMTAILLSHVHAAEENVPEKPSATPRAEGSEIIAWVGDEVVQSGDLLPTIEPMMVRATARMSAKQIQLSQDHIDRQREQLLRRALENTVEMKLMYLDFLRSLPDDKREMLPSILKRAEEQFDEKQLPEAMERADVTSADELDALLRTYGSSLAQQKRLFVQRLLGRSVLARKVNFQPEITAQEILDYYGDHAADFEMPSGAHMERGQPGSVPFDRVQADIKETLRRQKVGQQIEAYLRALRREIKVKTVFDEEQKL